MSFGELSCYVTYGHIVSNGVITFSKNRYRTGAAHVVQICTESWHMIDMRLWRAADCDSYCQHFMSITKFEDGLQLLQVQIPLGPVPRNFLVANVTRKLRGTVPSGIWLSRSWRWRSEVAGIYRDYSIREAFKVQSSKFIYFWNISSQGDHV